MLRIYIEEQCESVRIQLEGKLAGAWVKELKRCWQLARVKFQELGIVIELHEVSFVDSKGRSLLAEMHSAGAQLVGRGVLAQYLVESIQQREAG